MKKTISHISVITVVTLVLCFICVGSSNIFGSTIDWLSQHTVFADYFRTQFYKTGNFFPSFAASIGGGQNIYHYAYYGLQSPLVLISYLFPMVKMSDFMLVESICLIIAGGILLYFWLKSRGFTANNSFFVALLYVTAGPVIFHSHRHLMFINYMPFVTLALWGVDRHFDKKKSLLLCISTYLLIMTSFYYSIGGMITVVIYGIYRYIEVEEHKSVTSFLKAAFYFCLPIIIAILLSSYYLFPTLCALVGGRSSGGSAMPLSDLLIPIVNTSSFVGNSYAIGLNVVVLTAIFFFLIHNNGKIRFLIISILFFICIPVFSYILNGGLYLRNKVFIPFLPIMCFVIALFFQYLFLKKWNKREVIYLIISIVLSFLVLFMDDFSFQERMILLIHMALFTIGLVLYFIYKKPILCVLPVLLCSIHFCYFYNLNETYISKDLYNKVTDRNLGKALDQVLSNEKTFYRTDNLFNIRDTINMVYSTKQNLSSAYSSVYLKDYKDFTTNIMQNEFPNRNKLEGSVSWNPFYLRFMGVKYVIAKNPPAGYHTVYQQNGVSVHENDNVLPLGYVTNQTISTKQMMNLGYPYRAECLENYVAMDHGPTVSLKSNITPFLLSLPEVSNSHLSIVKKDNSYIVDCHKEKSINVPIYNLKQGDVLFIEMKIKHLPPYTYDINMNINGVNNVLTDLSNVYYTNENRTFHFAINQADTIKNLKIDLGEGKYEISDMKAYIMNINDIGSNSNHLGDYEVDQNKTHGDVISGTILAKSDGLFVSSIPYDKNFKVYVDNKLVSYQKVNTAFIGFNISKGKHQITFSYHSPGLTPGIMVSTIAFLIFAAMILIEYKTKKKRNI